MSLAIDRGVAGVAVAAAAAPSVSAVVAVVVAVLVVVSMSAVTSRYASSRDMGSKSGSNVLSTWMRCVMCGM